MSLYLSFLAVSSFRYVDTDVLVSVQAEKEDEQTKICRAIVGAGSHAQYFTPRVLF